MEITMNKDIGLIGNDKIENAILALQKLPTERELAHTLAVLRGRMQEHGQVILAVEPALSGTKLNVQTVTAPDGKQFWAAFTSFEEELKGSDGVMSTFLTDLEQLLKTALQTAEIEGVILNPWNRTLMLDKALIQLLL